METPSIIATIIGSVVSSQVLTVVAQAFFNRKKTSADAAQILLDKTLEWATRLSARIEKLEGELNNRDSVIAELKQQIAHLEACKVDKS